MAETPAALDSALEATTAADARFPSAATDTEISDVGSGSSTDGGVGLSGGALGQSLSPVTEQTPVGPGCSRTLSDRSPDTMSQVEAQWRGHQFPFVENADKTWKHAVETLKAALAEGFELRRLDKNKLYRTSQVGFAHNRVSIVHVICDQSGRPRPSNRVEAAGLRRRTGSKKASLCLRHLTPESGAAEHERSRAFDHELTAVEIHGQEDLIRLLHESRVETSEIHKTLQVNGKRLGQAGKQIVRNIRQKVEKATLAADTAVFNDAQLFVKEPQIRQKVEKATLVADTAVFNDAQLFVKELQQSGCFLRFKLDDQGRITSIAWAHPKQQQNGMKYHSVIIQGNMSNTCMYKFQLALIVVVDSENHTQLAMQALVSHEHTDDFLFIFEHFKELCSGAHPKVIFTNADKAASAAIEQVYPHSLHKLCIWHTMGEIRTHGGGLGPGVLQAVLGKFQAAAYTPIENAFRGFKTELLALLPPDSKMHAYMKDNIFGTGRVEKWASYVHPGAHTLGIASTQRVESGKSALKQVLQRSGTMVDVNRAILGKVQDDANKTERLAAGGRVKRVHLGTGTARGRVMDDMLKNFDYVIKAMEHEQCSTYSKTHMKSEVVACLGYDTEVLARGTNEVRHLLAELEADHSEGKLQYDTTCSADVTMPTRASVPHFVDLLRDQDVVELVRITPMFSAHGNGHLVALGLGGFFLCTCLKLLVDGLGCRHGIRAMIGRDVGFDGACLAPRWRKSETPWTMEALAAKPARLVSGSTGHSAGQQATTTAPDVFTHSSANVRGAVYANSVAFGKEVAEICGPIHTIEGHTRVLENVKNYMRQVVAVEVRSQSNASSSRVFRGAASQSARRGGGGVGQRQQGGEGRGGQRGFERGGETGGGINQGLGKDEVAGRGSSSGVGGQALPQTPTPQVTSHAVAAASGSAGDGMTENFARPTSNGENFHAFGGGVLSTSTNRQAQQSSSVSDQPENLAVFENLRPPEYQRPRGQSKRHATGSASRGRGRATRGPGEQLWSIAPR